MKYVVECKADSSLIKILLGIPDQKIIHAGNKGNVCNHLRRRKKGDYIGLVDEDPRSGQPRYLKKMKVKRDLRSYGLKILADANSNRLIVLCPRLEEWILGCSDEAGIDVRNYNLPNNGLKFHERINANLQNFEKLLKDPNFRKSCRLKTFKKWLRAKKF